MSTFKKLLALTLALAMVLSVSAFAGSYKADTYKDATSIDPDCEEAVELLYALDIMIGSNGEFRPEATITRAEVAKMIYVILNYGNDDLAVNYKGGKFFTDVPAGSWYEGYVNYMATTKLVQGRGDGTFGPNDPVKTAEVAKMLLTAIGYSSEARGYTGANWAQNVLSDAAVIGLLKGYNTNTNGYAPRQWVAVMFKNALLNALTFETMAPSVNGLLVNSSVTDYDTNYPTMGLKYYGLADFEAVAYATPEAYIDGYLTCAVTTTGHAHNERTCYSDYAASGRVRFSNGVSLKGTGLGVADLGQEYYVIYSVKNDTAYSVRSIVDTATARPLDMEVETKHNVSANEAENKYEFTVDGLTANFADEKIKVLKSGVADTASIAWQWFEVEDLVELIEDPAFVNDEYKVVTNSDGDIQYIIVTEYAYGQITNDVESDKYGRYIEITKPNGTDKVTFGSRTRLYVDDCITPEDELEKTNFVKYTWDVESETYVVEVLPIDYEVTFESRSNKNKTYVFDGETYMVAANGWFNKVNTYVTTSKLEKVTNLVVDGDLIVYQYDEDDTYTKMEDINAQLVLVIDAESEYSNGTIREQNAIEYMTIDGEKHIAVYQDKNGTSDIIETVDGYWTNNWYSQATMFPGSWYVPGYNVYKYVQFSELEGLGMDEYEDEDDLKGRLFILHEGTQGRVYLEKLSGTAADLQKQLNASADLLNGYIEESGELDATGTTVTFQDNRVIDDSPFFAAYDDGGEPVFTVVTTADLVKGYDTDAYGEVLTYTNSKGTRTTVLGGYLVFDLGADDKGGYLYAEVVDGETAAGFVIEAMMAGADATETIEVEKVILADGTVKTASLDEYIKKYTLYSYSYNPLDKVYTLTEMTTTDWVSEIVDLYNDTLYTSTTNFDLDKEVIAIREVWYDCGSTDAGQDDEQYEYYVAEEAIKFVKLADLNIDMIEDDVEGSTYTQYSNWNMEATKYLYIEVGYVMNIAQDDAIVVGEHPADAIYGTAK